MMLENTQNIIERTLHNKSVLIELNVERELVAEVTLLKLESDRNSFSAPKMTGFDSFGQFRFRP